MKRVKIIRICVSLSGTVLVLVFHILGYLKNEDALLDFTYWLRTKKSTDMSKECNTTVYEELGKLYNWMSKLSVNAVKASLWHCLSQKFLSHALYYNIPSTPGNIFYALLLLFFFFVFLFFSCFLEEPSYWYNFDLKFVYHNLRSPKAYHFLKLSIFFFLTLTVLSLLAFLEVYSVHKPPTSLGSGKGDW